MEEELGFRTPAKEIEKLRKRLEQIEGLSKDVLDAVTLSIWALAITHLIQARGNPKSVRILKDNLLEELKKIKVNPQLIDALDTMLKATCEYIEKQRTE